MSFSDKFLEIMKSNIRPKCEPKITVTGTAADGTTKTIEWNAKDIKSLSFHRSIDPGGGICLLWSCLGLKYIMGSLIHKTSR